MATEFTLPAPYVHPTFALDFKYNPRRTKGSLRVNQEVEDFKLLILNSQFSILKMGKVKTTWLAPGHSGSPCHHDSIYTKTDLRTGQVYSVKLCNPSDKVTADMAAQRTKFGVIDPTVLTAFKSEAQPIIGWASLSFIKTKSLLFAAKHDCVVLRKLVRIYFVEIVTTYHKPSFSLRVI